MREFDRPRVERDAAVGVRAAGAVFQVALDRAADLRELGADLVVAARKQFDLDERVVGRGAERAVAQPRLLRFGFRGVAGARAVGAAVAQHPVAQFPFERVGPLFRDGPVGFADFARTDHFIEPHQRLRGLGEEHCAAHGTVDAVHDAEKHLAGFRVAAFDVGLDLVFEGALARRIGLYEVAAALVDHQQVVVFVENIVGREHLRA